MTNHREAAIDHVEAVRAQSAVLDDLYSRPERVAPHLVGKAHDKLRQSVKLAQVHALLALVDEVRALRDLVDADAHPFRGPRREVK